MMALAASFASEPGWLRSRSFDLGLIAGAAGIALASGVAVALDPRLFAPILFLDLWLLGYHHVIATYTRLCFDRESFRTHRFLVLYLPLIVLATVVGAATTFGVWVLASIYLYWQWFHYTRQSYGIARMYSRKAGAGAKRDWIGDVALYLVSLWGILARSHQGPTEFLSLELRVIPITATMVDMAGVAAAAAVGVWLAREITLAVNGQGRPAYALYMLSHFAIFYVGYVATTDINAGWLVLNVWHNAKYLAIVWLFNNNQFRNGIDLAARFLSGLAQTRNAWRYCGVCVGLSMVICFLLINAATALPFLVVAFQTVNFHHYIVDAVIWKLRRPSIRATLGVAA